MSKMDGTNREWLAGKSVQPLDLDKAVRFRSRGIGWRRINALHGLMLAPLDA